jgi:hypothetical protein
MREKAQRRGKQPSRVGVAFGPNPWNHARSGKAAGQKPWKQQDKIGRGR